MLWYDDKVLNPWRRNDNCKHLRTRHGRTQTHKANTHKTRREISSNTALIGDFSNPTPKHGHIIQTETRWGKSVFEQCCRASRPPAHRQNVLSNSSRTHVLLKGTWDTFWVDHILSHETDVSKLEKLKSDQRKCSNGQEVHENAQCHSSPEKSSSKPQQDVTSHLLGWLLSQRWKVRTGKGMEKRNTCTLLVGL